MSSNLCISKVPLFNHLNIEEQKKIQKLLHHNEYCKGEIIFSPTSEAMLHIVSFGQMKVCTISTSGREQILRIIESGDYEGEKFLLGLSNVNCYGEALTNTNICSLYKKDFEHLCASYPEIINKLLYLNTKKLLLLEKRTQFLGLEQIDNRLAYYLLELFENQKSDTVHIPIPIYELASFLGTRAETISRKLKSFEQCNIINRNGKNIQIISVEKLKQIIL